MSDSRKKRAKNRKRVLDRPFAPAVLRRASELARSFKIILEPDPDEGFVGTSIEMPQCIGTGRTPDACVQDTREVLISALATMLELGEAPPTPSSQNLRQEQINIRVTSEEKLLLEEAARRRGFRGISDFVRSSTLAQLRSA
jgi:Uncharacterized conserved protein